MFARQSRSAYAKFCAATTSATGFPSTCRSWSRSPLAGKRATCMGSIATPARSLANTLLAPLTGLANARQLREIACAGLWSAESVLATLGNPDELVEAAASAANKLYRPAIKAEEANPVLAQALQQRMGGILTKWEEQARRRCAFRRPSEGDIPTQHRLPELPMGHAGRSRCTSQIRGFGGHLWHRPTQPKHPRLAN